MRRALLVITIACAFPVRGAAQQPPAVSLRFDVASVKPAPDNSVAMREGGGRLVLSLPLRTLIARAYGFDAARIVGGPSLMSRWFEITAKAENPEATRAEMNQMLKTLLLDRFQLRAHTEMRETRIWVLTRARSDGTLGPQLQRSSRSCVALGEEAIAKDDDPCNRSPFANFERQTGQPISTLVQLIRLLCCGSLEDRTGLTGAYDWELRFDTRALSVDPNAPTPTRPPLATALERQLALKLEEVKEPVEFLVIDSAAAPAPD